MTFYGYNCCVQGILKSTQSEVDVRHPQPILVQPAAVSSEFEVTGESGADLREYMTAIQDLESSEDISMPPKREHRPWSVVVGVGVVIVVVMTTGPGEQRGHQHASQTGTPSTVSCCWCWCCDCCCNDYRTWRAARTSACLPNGNTVHGQL